MIDSKNILLTTKDLYAGYGKHFIIHKVNIDVYEGEIISVLGANGSGKSTLLKALMNIVDNRKGEISFDGKDISNKSTQKLIQSGISILHQYNNLFSGLTIKQNIEISSKKNDVKNIYKYLDLLNEYSGGLFNDIYKYDWGKKRAGILSGGEKQKLALLMAFSNKPRLILMDEPTASLSSTAVSQVMNLIKIVNEKYQTTFVIVEQNIKSIMTITDKVLIMKNGRMNYIEDKNNLLFEEKLEDIFLK